MEKQERIALWKKEEAHPFQGWDFTHLDGRMIEESPPWDYLALAKDLVHRSRSLLDMATGGGEVLASLGPFPDKASAIEGYPPNVILATDRLAPLGVTVLDCNESAPLPFQDGDFDLVLNRHGGCWSPEIGRITMKGGVFLTQQIGGDNLADLMGAFGVKPQWPENTLPEVSSKLKGMGFEIEFGREWMGTTRFCDTGALVYFLKAIPWLVPGFSVITHEEALLRLQEIFDKKKELRFKISRFLIKASKS